MRQNTTRLWSSFILVCLDISSNTCLPVVLTELSPCSKKCGEIIKTGSWAFDGADGLHHSQAEAGSRASQSGKGKAVTAKVEDEAELLFIKRENEAKDIYRQSIDSEIADKEKQLKDERKARMGII